MKCEREKRAEIRRMTSFERFVSEKENRVLNSLIYCKPGKIFEKRSDMMKFWSSSDGTGSRIKNKLKTANLSSWKIEQKRVAVVNFRVNERSDNTHNKSSMINHVSYASEIPNTDESVNKYSLRL